MASSVVVAAPDAFAGTAARTIAEILAAAITRRGCCALALCGGTTPAAIYRVLTTIPIRWQDVTIYFGDERAISPDDAASNFGMARVTLIDRVPIPPRSVHRMEAERIDRDAAAREYAALLPDALDLLLLGVGPDGHTASLFPGSPALGETTRRVLAVASPPPPLQPQLRRMTITPPVIAAAREIVVMANGAKKADLLARILDGPEQPIRLPAQLARRGTWVLDQAAAGHLQQRDT